MKSLRTAVFALFAVSAMSSATGCGIAAGLTPNIRVGQTGTTASSKAGASDSEDAKAKEARGDEAQKSKAEQDALWEKKQAEERAKKEADYIGYVDAVITATRAKCKSGDIAVDISSGEIGKNWAYVNGNGKVWVESRNELIAAQQARIQAAINECFAPPKDVYKDADGAGLRKMFADAIAKESKGKVVWIALVDEHSERRQFVGEGHFYDSWFTNSFAVVDFGDHQEVWALNGERDTMNNNRLTLKHNEPALQYKIAYTGKSNVK